MQLCIDVGNTRIKAACFENRELIQFWAVQKEDWAQLLEEFTKFRFTKYIYSSVSLELPKLKAFLNTIAEETLWSYQSVPVPILYNTPATLGRDRIAAACAVQSEFKQYNTLVINLGSCITTDLIVAAEGFLGGNIAPGLRMRARAMHEFTSKLPLLEEFGSPDSLFGLSTEEAMQNGVIRGICAEIQYYFATANTKYDPLICVLTGGDANFFADLINLKTFVRPYLVLQGLNEILLHS
ncbi:MAG TPA: type III pantothenate kinase [Saprospiraceae bacterium]|nr:type III pantothenate kinase [Saprospiraceae bacterium]